MQKIRLKAIKFDADFRRSELTNYDSFRRSKLYPGELARNEAFLFVSRGGNQLIWILNISSVETTHANKRGRLDRRMIDTRRWRIEGGTSWDPMMLQNYANEVGIELVGIRRFEEIYEDRRAA